MSDGFSKAVMKDVKKRYNNLIKRFAEEVSFQIESAYESVISQFYADYGPNNGDPWYYKRTFSTYQASNGADNPYSPINVQHFGDSYFAGIGISASNIPGNPYKIYKGWVFDRTFYQGIHGITRKDIIKRNEAIRQKYKRQRALKKMLGKKFKNLQVDISMKGLTRNIPRNMTPPPKKLMDKEFIRITKKKNMDKMFNNIFENTDFN